MMKTIRLILVSLLVVLVGAGAASGQVVRRSGDNARERDKNAATQQQITSRQQAFYEQKEPHAADLQWLKVVYRQLDLTKGRNPALYYPEEPNEDGQSLFFIVMRLLADGKISAYEYLDGREMFTDEYKIKVNEMLDRFHVLFTEAKGSNEKHRMYTIEDADIPGNEILSYFIIEKWEFDIRTNSMHTRVDAICPVLHREDDYTGEVIRYPMFWVKLNDIRPYIAQQYVFTDDDNNLTRYNLDDFFKLNMYQGGIYKVKNLRNQSLMQQFPEPEAFKKAQDSIEARLHRFDKDLWVPTREELEARKAEREKLEAEKAAAEEGEDGDVEGDDGKKDVKKKDADEEQVKRSTKRGRKATGDDGKKGKKGKNKKNKQPKAKQQQAKNSNSGATRSVRNRKR